MQQKSYIYVSTKKRFWSFLASETTNMQGCRKTHWFLLTTFVRREIWPNISFIWTKTTLPILNITFGADFTRYLKLSSFVFFQVIIVYFYLTISVWNRILLSPRTNGYLWFLWTLQNAASLSTSAKTSPPTFRHGKVVAPKGQLWKRRWHCEETGSRTVQVYWLLQIWSLATFVVLHEPIIQKFYRGNFSQV